MPLCPDCEQPIDFLVVEEEHTHALKVEEGKPVHDDTLLEEWQLRNNYTSFACPHCSQELDEEKVQTEEDAVKFLTGELVLPMLEKVRWQPTTEVWGSRRKKKTNQMEMPFD